MTRENQPMPARSAKPPKQQPAPLNSKQSQTSTQSDETLLMAVARHRDLQAFTEIYDRYEKIILSVSMRLTRNMETAKDLHQDTMLQVWTSADSFDPQKSVRKWIVKIAFNKGLKHLQNSIKETSARSTTQRKSPFKGFQEIEKQELNAIVHQELKELPPIDRKILKQYYEGHTQNAIAQHLDVPQRTISYRIQRTLSILRPKLAELFSA